MEIKELNLEEDSEAALKVAASCLQAYLKLHGGAERPYKVLSFLASATLSRIEQGKPTKFINMDLQEGITGGIGKDSSAWLSPIWKKLSTETLHSIQDSMEGFARTKGYDFYPWVGKTESTGGSGNSALYFLVARKVASESQSVNEPLQHADIHYLPAVKITPSWWARWLFNRDYSAHGWRKKLYVWAAMVWLLFFWLFASLLWMALSWKQTPLSTQDAMLAMFVIGIVMYCWHVFRQFSILFDDRIMLAPDKLIGIAESNVCIEVVKENLKNKSSPRVLRLVKYMAECPICGTEVLLDKGEPDFPRRIIGRCQESPREHIFSFDRVTKTGMKLRGVNSSSK